MIKRASRRFMSNKKSFATPHAAERQHGPGSSQMHIRNWKGRMASGVQVYQNAAKRVVNNIGLGKSTLHDQQYYQELSKIPYCGNAARDEFMNRYLEEIRGSYAAQSKQSCAELESALELVDKVWIEKEGSVPEAGTSKELKKKYDEVVRKVQDAHVPKVYAVPGTGSFEYLEQAIRMVFSQRTICFSIDVEAFEFNTNVITEIGISVYDPRESVFSTVPNVRNYHLIVGESLQLRNRKFVCDFKDCFILGESMVMSLVNCVEFIQSLINYYMVPVTAEDATWNRAFVGHNVKGDLKWLGNIGVEIPRKLDHALTVHKRSGKASVPPNPAATPGPTTSAAVAVLDTEKLYQVCFGNRGCNLGKVLRLLRLPHAFLHNAGNDAHYTLKLLLHMCDINFRRHTQLDDFTVMSDRIRGWLAREREERKVLPMSYSMALSEFKSSSSSSSNSTKKKHTVSQTEFGGCRWYGSAGEALVAAGRSGHV